MFSSAAGLALAGIAVEQGLGCLAAQHGGQLPAEVVGILHAGVGAARAERRHAVRGIAGEQHPAVAEVLHALAGERVDADPLDLEAASRHGRCSRAARARAG